MDRLDITGLIDLAEAVDRDGLDAHTSTLFALAQRALELGVSPVVPDVMLDSHEPSVARLRAFTRLSAVVARHGGSGTTDTDQRVAVRA